MSERSHCVDLLAEGRIRPFRRNAVARWLIGFSALLFATTVIADDRDTDRVLVFAAASLKPALDALFATPDSLRIGAIRVSYAASSQLARQIEHEAPASIFISADRDWMDHLEARGLIVPETRIDLLGNALVLIAPIAGTASVDLEHDADLAAVLGTNGHLAIAEPDSVPAGKYAKAALVSLGLWTQIETKTVRAGNVRAALNFVARGEAELGIVYRSDALSEPAVRIVDSFSAELHTAIVYPAAVIAANDSPAARATMQLLHSDVARTMFLRFGFDVMAADAGGEDDWTR